MDLYNVYKNGELTNELIVEDIYCDELFYVVKGINPRSDNMENISEKDKEIFITYHIR